MPAAAAGGYGNAFGSIPQPIQMPGSLYGQALASVPGLGPLGGSTATTIGQQLTGQLSPSTVSMLENKAADYGVNMGMPGMTPGSLALNNLMANMGLASEQLQQQGVSNYGNFLGSIASTQLDPALQADVSEWNSIMRAAPDPQSAAMAQLSLLNQYMKMLNPAGASGGESFAGVGDGGRTQNPWSFLGPGTYYNPSTQTYHTPATAGR